jgi:hypothetical protein
MQTDQTIYLTDATTITIERVPSRGLVRIKIKGKEGGVADEVSLTIWGNALERTMPEITDTTSPEPAISVEELDDEEADI